MSRKKSNRRKPVRPVVRTAPVNWRKPALTLGMTVIAGAVLFAAGMALDRPFKSVTVHGEFQRVTTLQVEAVVATLLSGGFITVDIEALRAGMSNLPWIDRVRVQRRWPDALVVSVEEQVAAARWGETGLLNTRGELFVRDARRVPPELPRLDGPAGAESRVARRYLAMSSALAESGFELRALTLDARGAWRLQLAGGLEVRLGRRDVDTRMERFTQVVAGIVHSRLSEVAYVDMRYSNGFAVGWRSAAEAGNAENEETASDA